MYVVFLYQVFQKLFKAVVRCSRMRIITHISVSYHTVASTILRLSHHIGQYFVESVLCVTTSVFLYCCYFAENFIQKISLAMKL